MTPKHVNINSTSSKAVEIEDRDMNGVVNPVARQGSSVVRGVGDTATGSGDRAIRTNPAAHESSYAAAFAAHGQHTSDAATTISTTQPEFSIEVEDGHVVATVEPVLTDAAADVLWRVIAKATRNGGAT